MSEEPMRCTRCGRSVEPERRELYERAGDAGGVLEPLCVECATESAPEPEAVRAPLGRPDWARDEPAPSGQEEAAPEPVAGRSPEEVLDEILRELKHIARNQEYEPFSVWNIFGGLVQCVVLFLLFWHYFKGDPPLMWALVLQVFALTLFVLAKK